MVQEVVRGFKMKMPNMLGSCGEEIEVKVWKRGHSFACLKRKRGSIRYWVPEPSIDAELENYCWSCPNKPDSPVTTKQ